MGSRREGSERPWALAGVGERYLLGAMGSGTALVVLPGTDRSIPLKDLRSTAATPQQLCVIYERVHKIYEDLKKHQHTADFL